MVLDNLEQFDDQNFCFKSFHVAMDFNYKER